MSRSTNIAVQSGNLTKDVELRTTQGGTPVATISIAVNSREKVNGEWADVAHYFTWTVWGATAENCAQWLHKGSHVELAGRARWRQYETNDGQKRSVVEFVADNVVFPPKSQSTTNPAANSSSGPSNADFASTPDDDDIPW